MKNNIDFLVSVRCFTYNHAPYIVDAMNGFVNQVTTFPYICIIVDDASTDGEQNVIREYLEKHFKIQDKSVTKIEENDNYKMVFSQHSLNEKCYFAVFYLKYNHYSTTEETNRKYSYFSDFYRSVKYCALCEGDDYWVDSHKLQKQVDFLDDNPEYGMCHTDFALSDGGRRTHYTEKYPNGDYFPGLLLNEDGSIGTATVLFRKEVYEKTPKYYFKEYFVAADKARWIELAKEAKIKYLPCVTACYRILTSSASHSSSFKQNLAFREGLQAIRKFYAEKYNIKLTNYENYYTNLLKICYISSERSYAEKFYYEAKRCHSLTFKGFVFYIGAKYKVLHRLLETVITPK